MTVTINVPLCARSLGCNVPTSRVEFMKVVARAALFTRTVEPDTKPVPITFKLSALLPAATLVGERDASPGVIVNGIDEEAKPSGSVTNTSGLPEFAIALAGIKAVSWP